MGQIFLPAILAFDEHMPSSSGNSNHHHRKRTDFGWRRKVKICLRIHSNVSSAYPFQISRDCGVIECSGCCGETRVMTEERYRAHRLVSPLP